MYPYIELFGRNIETYHIMALFGIFSAGVYSCLVSEARNIDYTETVVFLLIACIGVILGSHTLYILVNFRYIGTKEPFIDMARLFLSGSVFYGGLIGGAGITYIFRKKFANYSRIIEIVTPAIPLFHFFGRIGCFLYGCCFGIENSIGFKFISSPVEIANGSTRLPIQLVESIYNLFLFILLNKVKSKKIFRNNLLHFYLLLYSSGRFVFEFYRSDAYRGIWFQLSTSQIISIVVFAVALWGIIKYLRKIRRSY